MKDLPPLNGLRAFEVSGRHLNFRIASEELGVTQGAVAQQVRLLESNLGFQLFERLPNGLAFTQVGRSYHAEVAAAFEGLREATLNLRPHTDSVLISVTPSFAAKWLIPNLPDFSRLHPNVDFRILATEKVSSFHADGIDLAIRQGSPPFGAALDAELLFRQEIVAVASPGFVGKRALPLSSKDVALASKLHDAHNLWPEFLDLLAVENQSDHGLRLSQSSLAIEAALSGQGIALVSRFLIEQELASGNLVQVSDAIYYGPQDFYLLSKRKSKRSKSVDAAVQWLTDRAHTT